MEKSRYDPPGRKTLRSTTPLSSSSSSSTSSKSSTSQSNKFHPNPTRNARNSNPNRNNTIARDDYSKNAETQLRPLQFQQQQQEEDLLMSSSLVGTCPFMCPVEEMVQRERLRDLSVFERLNGSQGKSSPSLAVKKFCRTISAKDVQASDVRPLPVLEDTLNYLLKLLDSKDHPFEVVHDFIFDRTRSIRQDLSMQNIVNSRVIQMFENMVKFHVVSHHKLRRCGDTQNISSIHYLNMEQLTKVLTSLYHLYDANRNSQSIYEKEAEFRSLYVLLHLSSDSKPMGEQLSFWFRHSSPFVKSKEMCFARRVLRYYRFGNYKRFIQTTAADASYLQYCIIEPYINEVRALAVSCVNYGCYKLHPYPLEDLAKLLMMKESDMESFCRDCGLETSTDQGKKFLPTKQTSFSPPKGGFNYCIVGLELFESVY